MSLTAQVIYQELETEMDSFFKTYVSNGVVLYADAKEESASKNLSARIKGFGYASLSKQQQKAFFINVYNFAVIDKVIDKYPITSVHEIVDFFEKKDIQLIDKKVSLDQIENELLSPKDDPRLHFALICGANGCPPILNAAYKADNLDLLLDIQTKIAVNSEHFVKYEEEANTARISEIFNWYSSDFKSKDENIIDYINRYLIVSVPNNAKVSSQRYDWSINDFDVNNAGTNDFRYIASSIIPKGDHELKVFNNLYFQRTPIDGSSLERSSAYFTTTVGYLYGLNHKLNIGFDLRYRRVANEEAKGSPLNAFKDEDGIVSRSRIATIGPKIRWAPNPKRFPNLSIQTALWITTADNLETSPFLDWDHMTFLTQIFNDVSIGNKYSLFTELDILLEDIGGEDETNRFSTPATLIFSYFPSNKSTVYLLSQYSPIWQEEYDYYYQLGIGAKYQIKPTFEVEVLWSHFDNKFLNSVNGSAATYNLGFRYSH